MIDQIAFAPVTALIGGALIGLSAAVLMLFNGKTAGISGIFGSLVLPQSGWLWRAVFLVALVLGALVAAHFGIVDGQIRPVASTPFIVIAGLLVGAGTRFGAGCTSGHGICGMSRFSLRSIVAVAVFMATGFITATLMGSL